MRLPKPFVAAEVKARANFFDIVSQYTRLRRAGKQSVGLCPFHSERHPSFYIHVEKKVFYCFGCGFGGDVFDFVMQAEDLPFTAALEWIDDFQFRQSAASGVARESEPRSGERFRAGVGASPQAAKRPASNNQSAENTRTQALNSSEASNRRLRAIEATNRAASAALATPCEPDRATSSSFTCHKPDKCVHERVR
jgi:DNA primase